MPWRRMMSEGPYRMICIQSTNMSWLTVSLWAIIDSASHSNALQLTRIQWHSHLMRSALRRRFASNDNYESFPFKCNMNDLHWGDRNFEAHCSASSDNWACYPFKCNENNLHQVDRNFDARCFASCNNRECFPFTHEGMITLIQMAVPFSQLKRKENCECILQQVKVRRSLDRYLERACHCVACGLNHRLLGLLVTTVLTYTDCPFWRCIIYIVIIRGEWISDPDMWNLGIWTFDKISGSGR